MRLRWAVNCSAWVPTKEEWMSALSVIQLEEVKRIGQFVFQRDAKFAIVGRLLIRAGLSEHNIMRPFSLGRSEHGKPILLDQAGGEDTSISFNLSHQGNYVVLAMEEEKSVGVDIMQLSQPRGTSSLQQFFHTMTRKFSSMEWSQIMPPHSSPQQQLNNFYRFWTLKESFVKAEGSGLSYGLQNLEFECGSGWPPPPDTCCVKSKLYIRGKLAGSWRFEESMLDDEHCVAVAVAKTRSDVPLSPFFILTVEYLLTKILQPSQSLDSKVLQLSQLLREWDKFQKMKHSMVLK